MLQVVCFPNDYKDNTRKGAWWLVLHGTEPVAFGGISGLPLEPSVGIFTRAGVMSDHRGKGLQGRLINVRLRYARKQGWDTVLTSTYDNPPSANNLIDAGFRIYDPSWHWMCAGTTYWKRKLNG